MDRNVMIKKYCDALNEGRAAIFAGAGLSASAGFVNWAGLLKDVADELNCKIDAHTNLVDLAQYYVNETKSTHELSRAILNKFPSSTAPTINHQILASLPIDTYWTTNFDKLIERSLEEANIVYDVKSLPERLAISKSGSKVTVYKMHGDVDNPHKTILTRDHFEQYPNTHQAFLNNFNYDLTNRTFIFLGLSFDDPNLQYVMKYARNLYKENQRVHYYILRKLKQDTGESDEAFANRKRMQELFVEDLKNYGIQTVMIDEYDEITEILIEIKRRYLRKTIFISGAAHEYGNYSETDFKAFLRKLSYDLISHDFRIVNGYGLGFGNEVVAGAMEAINDMHKTVDGNLTILPFPQNIPDPVKMWQIHRENMISKTGVTLFFLGNKIDKSGKVIPSNGMQSEYDISKANGNFLIPVGATGFITKQLWDMQMKDIAAGGTIYDGVKDDLIALGDSTLSLDQIRKLLISLIEKINS